MLTFYSDHQKAHSPSRELNNGDWMDYAESTLRLDSILAQLGKTDAPQDQGMDPILAVHSADYINFLKTAYRDWIAQGRSGDAIGYAFPVRGRRPLDHDRIDARLGQFGFDAATPIADNTWDAAYWGAQTALSALNVITKQKAKTAFALCRPPGHHAGRDYYGGYCYLNNAAIAAKTAHTEGHGPVAILDVDYHHGNGTQDIFYEDSDVFFASIHADPVNDYPYFWGHNDEIGEGAGKGATLNQPLERGTNWSGYEKALAKALEAITSLGARTLVVSYGADTFANDPISHFALTTDDMNRIGCAIKSASLPTLAVMEGGYDIKALGANVDAFLTGLEYG